MDVDGHELVAVPRGDLIRRRSKLPTVFLAGLLVGVGLAAVAVPNRHSDDVAAGQATALGGAAAVAATDTGGAVPAPAAGTGAASAAPASSQSGGFAAAPSSGPTTSAPSASPTGAPASAASAPAQSNGGATFKGVTATDITIAVANFDSNAMGAVCPRCGNGDVAKGAATDALVEAWRRDGLLPVNGRNFKLVNVTYNALNPEEAQSACDHIAQDIHPFLVVTTTSGLTQCLAQQHQIMTVAQLGTNQAFARQVNPYSWSLESTRDAVYLNYAIYLDRQGLLKNQVVCMYSPEDPQYQKDLDGSLRAQLQKLGSHLVVDITYGTTPNDAVAVTKFRSAGCTVALMIGGLLTEPSGFQNVAEQQGYHPKYPIAESGPEMNDAVADVTYNANAEDGNLGFKTEFFNWSSRKPPVPVGNQAAAYCLKSYQEHTHRTLDLYDNLAVVENALEICAPMEVARQAIVNAGPNLTYASFVAGMEQIHGMQTSDYMSVSYGPTKRAGNDTFAPWKFNKARWQPANSYWGAFGPWTQFYLGPQGEG